MLRFAEFSFDPVASCLLLDGHPVDLQPKVVVLLQTLLSAPGKLWTHDELDQVLWPDTHVTGDSLCQAVSRLRAILRDDPRKPRFVQTVPRRGYRWVAAVVGGPARGAPPRDLDTVWAPVGHPGTTPLHGSGRRPTGNGGRFRHLLVVEDSTSLRQTLRGVLEPWADRITAVGSVGAARHTLRDDPPDALVLDFALPDGDGFDVLRAVAAGDCLPAIVAMSGTAEPDETFRLSQLGVRAFLPKPIQLDALERALEDAATTAPDLELLLRASVGRVGYRQVEDQVRRTMVTEALARTAGKPGRAAYLLEVSRQLLHRLLGAA